MATRKNTAISLIARTGYIAKGLVYFMVGALTLQAAIGMGGGTSDATDAFREFIYQPFGSFLLVGIIIGLISHSVWRVIQGVKDPENRGGGIKVLFSRLVDILTGFVYFFMSFAAWQILQGLGGQDGDEATKVWVEKIMELPQGSWLVMCLAVVILAGGLYQFYSAWTASFESSFSSRMNNTDKHVLRSLGRIGIVSWGVVYCMVAFLFYRASMSYDPEEAGGISDALNALREQPYGIWILAITAIGLIIYGIYLLILSHYHKIFEEIEN